MRVTHAAVLPFDAQAAVATRDEARAAIDAVLDEYHVWALPVASVQPFSHNYDQSDVDVNGKPVAYWRALISYVLPFTVTGHPVVTMPVVRPCPRPSLEQLVAAHSLCRRVTRIAGHAGWITGRRPVRGPPPQRRRAAPNM